MYLVKQVHLKTRNFASTPLLSREDISESVQRRDFFFAFDSENSICTFQREYLNCIQWAKNDAESSI